MRSVIVNRDGGGGHGWGKRIPLTQFQANLASDVKSVHHQSGH